MKTILLVEDNPDDAFLLKIACLRSGFPHFLAVVTDGRAAIDYLSGADIYTDRDLYPYPDLVFLDIKIPKQTGHEVLKWIGHQTRLKKFPVIMLTNSQESSDVSHAYKLGVTSFLHKTGDMAEFGQRIRIILKYWFELNVSPR